MQGWTRSEPSSGRPRPDRRSDLLLRSIVQCCRPDFERQGFRLDGRGSSDERTWVSFKRPGRDAGGHKGTLVVLVAHGRPEQTLLFDAYFVDTALDLHTPHTKLLQRYDGDAELPGVVRQAVDRVFNWASGPSGVAS